MELLLDEVYMHDEKDFPRLLWISQSKQLFIVEDPEGKLPKRYFKFSKPISELTETEKERVFNYSYATNDRPTELMSDDVFVHGEFIEEVFPVKDLESGEISFWSVEGLLDEINRDRSGEWTDYDTTDWREGWNEWVEGEFYSLVN